MQVRLWGNPKPFKEGILQGPLAHLCHSTKLLEHVRNCWKVRQIIFHAFQSFMPQKRRGGRGNRVGRCKSFQKLRTKILPEIIFMERRIPLRRGSHKMAEEILQRTANEVKSFWMRGADLAVPQHHLEPLQFLALYCFGQHVF